MKIALTIRAVQYKQFYVPLLYKIEDVKWDENKMDKYGEKTQKNSNRDFSSLQINLYCNLPDINASS